MEAAREIQSLGISTIFLQSGQDLQTDEVVRNVLPELKSKLNLNVILNLGERSKQRYREFAESGADGYILKFETSDATLYEKVAHTDHARRIQCLHWIKETGMKLGTGNLVGLPYQSLSSIAQDILLAAELQPDFVSVSPFVPNEDTPLEHLPYGDYNVTLNTMALYRIALGGALVPTVSALEKVKVNGQIMGFHAGANVITINFTPMKHKEKYRIYARERFIVSLEHALNTVRAAGLEPPVSVGDHS
jgi:biotin synthase